MSEQKAALVVVDAQESFRHRPYWDERDYPRFVQRLQALIDGAIAGGLPVAFIFHLEDRGDFALGSGYIRTLTELSVTPEAVFHKRSHSALIGSGLDLWLAKHGIGRIIVGGIRTEQCCETTTRHASDLGYAVDFVSEATLTFAMVDRKGRTWSAEEIKERTELVLAERFARIVTVEEALATHPALAAQ